MHAECYRVKGTLCLKQGNFQVALIAFSQANSLEKNLSSFSGNIFKVIFYVSFDRFEPPLHLANRRACY